MRRLRFSSRAAMLGSFAGTSIVNYAFGLVMGWLLLPGDFGLLAFTQTVLLIAGLILNSGFAYTLTSALVNEAPSRRGPLIRGAGIANLLLALGMSGCIVLLFTLGPLQPGFETMPVVGAVALTLPLLAVIAIMRAAMQGTERFGAVALLQITEVLGKAIAGLAFVWLGLGAFGAIAGFFVGALSTTVLAFGMLMGALGIHPIGPVERPALRVAGSLFGALIGLALILNLDLIALKLFSTAERALIGQYQAAIVLANTPYYLAAALMPILFTRTARLSKLSLTAGVVGEWLRLALLIILPLEFILVAAPGAILRLLFPVGYAAGATPLRILALGNCAIILVGIVSTAFQATGNARVPARILFGIAASEVVILGIVVPRWHAVGAASTFLSMASLSLLLLSGAYLRMADVGFHWRKAGWSFKYGVSLALGVLLSRLLAGAGYHILLAVAVGGLGYFICCVLLRVVVKPWFVVQFAIRTAFLGQSTESQQQTTAVVEEHPLMARLANPRKRSKLLFIGNYGNRNIGDDAILQILSERYAAEYSAYDQYVFARHYTADIGRISRAQPMLISIRSLLWVMWHVRLVVIGGGGLFGAHMGPAARFIPIFALLCRLLGKGVIYESVGMYSNTPHIQRVLLFLSMLTAWRVSVRDETSWSMTAPVRRYRIVHLVDDPGFAIAPIGGDAALALLRNEGISIPPDRSRVIGLSVKRVIRDRTQTERLYATLVQTCQWLLDHGYYLLFIPFCDDPAKWSEQDVTFAEEISAQLQHHGRVACVQTYYKPREVAGLLRLTSLCIGMRFHAQVFAHAIGIPLLPIAYEDKRKDFIRKYGYPLLPIDQLSSNGLIMELERMYPIDTPVVRGGAMSGQLLTSTTSNT